MRTGYSYRSQLQSLLQSWGHVWLQRRAALAPRSTAAPRRTAAAAPHRSSPYGRPVVRPGRRPARHMYDVLTMYVDGRSSYSKLKSGLSVLDFRVVARPKTRVGARLRRAASIRTGTPNGPPGKVRIPSLCRLPSVRLSIVRLSRARQQGFLATQSTRPQCLGCTYDLPHFAAPEFAQGPLLVTVWPLFVGSHLINDFIGQLATLSASFIEEDGRVDSF